MTVSPRRSFQLWGCPKSPRPTARSSTITTNSFTPIRIRTLRQNRIRRCRQQRRWRLKYLLSAPPRPPLRGDWRWFPPLPRRRLNRGLKRTRLSRPSPPRPRPPRRCRRSSHRRPSLPRRLPSPPPRLCSRCRRVTALSSPPSTSNIWVSLARRPRRHSPNFSTFGSTRACVFFARTA